MTNPGPQTDEEKLQYIEDRKTALAFAETVCADLEAADRSKSWATLFLTAMIHKILYALGDGDMEQMLFNWKKAKSSMNDRMLNMTLLQSLNACPCPKCFEAALDAARDYRSVKDALAQARKDHKK